MNDRYSSYPQGMQMQQADDKNISPEEYSGSNIPHTTFGIIIAVNLSISIIRLIKWIDKKGKRLWVL